MPAFPAPQTNDVTHVALQTAQKKSLFDKKRPASAWLGAPLIFPHETFVRRELAPFGKFPLELRVAVASSGPALCHS
jgi:hypothetical protein